MSALSRATSELQVAQPEGLVDQRLVTGHFAVNQTALSSMVRPMVAETLQELNVIARLNTMEAAATRMQVSLEHKAEARSLKELVTTIHEHERQLQAKADLRTFNEVKAIVSHLEESVAWKADQTMTEELAGSFERLTQLVGTKADLTYVNRTNTLLTKLSQVSSQQEKLLAETVSSVEGLEKHHLPQAVQRNADALSKLRSSLKQVQDVLTTKADISTIEEFRDVLKEFDGSIKSKVSTQAALELNAAVRDIQHQLVLKVDQLSHEEGRTELQRIGQLLENKVERQEFQEHSVLMQSLQQNLAQKAELQSLNEAKTRCMNLEVALEHKADRHDIGEVNAALTTVREGLSQKADWQLLGETSTIVDRMQVELGQKAEAHSLNSAQASIDDLKQIASLKADHEHVANQLDEVSRRLENVVSQLRQKADVSSMEDVVALVQSLAPSSAQFSPNSSVSGSTAPSCGVNGSARSLPGRSAWGSGTLQTARSKSLQTRALTNGTLSRSRQPLREDA